MVPKNTAAGGQRMGRSLTKYSFARDGDLNKPVGKINFGDNWNEQMIQWGMNSSNGIIDYGLHANNGQSYDLKSHDKGLDYEGSILFSEWGDDVYGSRRDAGNFLAGAKAQRSILPTDGLIYGFGAFNAAGNKIKNIPSTVVSDIVTGGGLLKAPYYGEGPQSGSAIMQGVKHYKKFSNNWFFPERKPARKK